MRAVAPAKPTARPVFISEVPFDHQRIGAAALYCSDGRYGEQMDDFLHKSLGLPRYDRVAIPGGAGCLAGHIKSYQELWALDRQLTFLIQSHDLNRIVLIAHEGCGFYADLAPPSESIEPLQRADLQKAADHIRLWNLGVTVDGYFARKVNGRVAFENWLHG
jgi:hypothetical protein